IMLFCGLLTTSLIRSVPVAWEATGTLMAAEVLQVGRLDDHERHLELLPLMSAAGLFIAEDEYPIALTPAAPKTPSDVEFIMLPQLRACQSAHLARELTESRGVAVEPDAPLLHGDADAGVRLTSSRDGHSVTALLLALIRSASADHQDNR